MRLLVGDCVQVFLQVIPPKLIIRKSRYIEKYLIYRRLAGPSAMDNDSELAMYAHVDFLGSTEGVSSQNLDPGRKLTQEEAVQILRPVPGTRAPILPPTRKRPNARNSFTASKPPFANGSPSKKAKGPRPPKGPPPSKFHRAQRAPSPTLNANELIFFPNRQDLLHVGSLDDDPARKNNYLQKVDAMMPHERRQFRAKRDLRYLHPTDGAKEGGHGTDDARQEFCFDHVTGDCRRPVCKRLHQMRAPRVFNLCKFYMTNTCARGNLCEFMHADFPCRYFYLGLPHQRAEACRFKHGGPLPPPMATIFVNSLEHWARKGTEKAPHEFEPKYVALQQRYDERQTVLERERMERTTVHAKEAVPAPDDGFSLAKLLNGKQLELLAANGYMRADQVNQVPMEELTDVYGLTIDQILEISVHCSSVPAPEEAATNVRGLLAGGTEKLETSYCDISSGERVCSVDAAPPSAGIIEDSIEGPIEAPNEPPIEAQNQTPAEPPLESSNKTPAQPPLEALKKTPAQSPIKDLNKIPAERPIETPAEPFTEEIATAPPHKTSAETPIETPIDVSLETCDKNQEIEPIAVHVQKATLIDPDDDSDTDTEETKLIINEDAFTF